MRGRGLFDATPVGQGGYLLNSQIELPGLLEKNLVGFDQAMALLGG